MKKNSINPVQKEEIIISNEMGISQIESSIDQIEGMENQEIESPKKINKIRSYNNPLFKSSDLNDLSSIEFPLIFQKENEKGEMIEEKFDNRFGDLKKGDIFNMRLNPNNKNSFPIGKILFFRIQSNGFWIKYLSSDGKRYFKNMNLFIGLSNELEIKDFEARLKDSQIKEEIKG